MRSDIEKVFDDYIGTVFKTRPDLKKFFIAHPRKNVCIDNLCEQIAACERRIYSIKFDSATYRQTIRDVARFFCETALRQKDQSLLSDAEKTRQRRENERDQYVEEAVEELKKDGLIIDNEATVKELPDDGEGQEETAKGGLIL